jgi:hypothetical protein
MRFYLLALNSFIPMSSEIYLPSGTDITIRWKKMYGYIPASEMPEIQQKWKEWKEKLAKGIEDLQPAEAAEKLTKMRKRSA